MSVKISIKIKPVNGNFLSALQEEGEVQRFLVDQVAEGVNPYLPKDTGFLESNITKNKSSITWTAPYAKELWYGKTKTGKDMKFNKSKNPKAGRMWALRYKEEQLEKLKSIIIRKVNSLR